MFKLVVLLTPSCKFGGSCAPTHKSFDLDLHISSYWRLLFDLNDKNICSDLLQTLEFYKNFIWDDNMYTDPIIELLTEIKQIKLKLFFKTELIYSLVRLGLRNYPSLGRTKIKLRVMLQYEQLDYRWHAHASLRGSLLLCHHGCSCIWTLGWGANDGDQQENQVSVAIRSNDICLCMT